MLKLVIPGEEVFNSETSKFSTINDTTLELEHSLVALSKWESKWQKAFLGKHEHTQEETLDYVRCMILTPDFPPGVFSHFNADIWDKINEYINSRESATWVSEPSNRPASKETVTSELIYYWMTALNIPLECQYWHLNRLFNLIKVANYKNAAGQGKKPKLGRDELAARRELMAQRRNGQSG